VLEDQALEQGLGGPLLLGAESGDGLELQSEIVVGPSLVVPEDQVVGGDAQGHGQVADGVQRWLGFPGFVAAQLDDADGGSVGQALLGQLLGFACSDQSFWKAHGDHLR